jgi:hypothetical protein
MSTASQLSFATGRVLECANCRCLPFLEAAFPNNQPRTDPDTKNGLRYDPDCAERTSARMWGYEPISRKRAECDQHPGKNSSVKPR